MSAELKPCPFCGHDLIARWTGANPKASCKTDGCWGAKLPTICLDVPEQIAAWNTRTEAIAAADAVIAQPVPHNVPREWRRALRQLAFMARTSGGTAGPDRGLMDALLKAEKLLSEPYLPEAQPVPAQAVVQPHKGLTVQADADGVWLDLSASTGRCALLNVERIADSHGGIVSKALRDWAADVAAAPAAPTTDKEQP